MEVKLENLIEKLKSEGVEGAQREANEIIEKAKSEADAIIAKAKKDAEDIVAKAETKAQQFQQNSELAIKQAARDGELYFKGKINDLFDKVFKREAKAALAPDLMKEMILKIVDGWKSDANIELVASDEDAKKLQDLLFASLKEELKDGVLIKGSSDIQGGFKIGMKDENVYYDFSDESLAEVLKSFLNPRLNEILGKKNG